MNDVYNHYVRTSACTFDIDETSLEARMKWFDGFADRYKIVVAIDDQRLLGYACTRPLFERRAYETSCSCAVYVRPEEHGKGIGKHLYRALFDALSVEDLHRAYAGVTMPNDGSVALHESFGFKQAAYFTEQGRKFDRYWDVAWYEKAL